MFCLNKARRQIHLVNFGKPAQTFHRLHFNKQLMAIQKYHSSLHGKSVLPSGSMWTDTRDGQVNSCSRRNSSAGHWL